MPVMIVLFLLTATGPAVAHGPSVAQPDSWWLSWNSDPLFLLPLAISLCLYARGVARLWSRPGRRRGVSRARILSFALGAVALIVALASPIDALGEVSLSVHMIQHALLVVVAPPLLVLARPGVAFAWGLSLGGRRSFMRSATWRSLAGAGESLSRPLPAAALHGLALWIWHAPAPFDAAVANYWLHLFEHASFFGTALLFWRAVLHARAKRAGRAFGAAFATLMHGGFLGALITLAPYPLYSAYHHDSGPWGLSRLADQQLAGLLMWVPMGTVYLCACLLLVARLAGIDKSFGEPRQGSVVSVEGGQP